MCLSSQSLKNATSTSMVVVDGRHQRDDGARLRDIV